MDNDITIEEIEELYLELRKHQKHFNMLSLDSMLDKAVTGQEIRALNEKLKDIEKNYPELYTIYKLQKDSNM